MGFSQFALERSQVKVTDKKVQKAAKAANLATFEDLQL